MDTDEIVDAILQRFNDGAEDSDDDGFALSDTQLRIEALHLALTGVYDWLTDDVTKRAESFYKFLKGGDE